MMIDVMENKVLAPIMEKRFEEGIEKGLEKGLEKGGAQGHVDLLREQLTDKFGSLPQWAAKRVETASTEDLHVWAKRILRNGTLNDILA